MWFLYVFAAIYALGLCTGLVLTFLSVMDENMRRDIGIEPGQQAWLFFAISFIPIVNAAFPAATIQWFLENKRGPM